MNITLCIICKNEEEKITRCINSCKNIVNEIVVVDTGSTDQTVDRVKELGINVLEIPWENDFSKARNYAIEHAHGEWIIFLDADEYFVKECKEEIYTGIANAKKRGNEYILCQIINLSDKGIRNCFKTIRIFENKKTIRYTGKIHERLIKANGILSGEDCSEKIEIYHDGYMSKAINKQNKKQRNKKMLMEELEQHPESSDIYFYLMQEFLHEPEEKDKSWEYGLKAMENNNFKLISVKEVIYSNLLNLCSELNKEKHEAEKIYLHAVSEFDDYPDIEFWYGYYLCDQGDTEGCILHLESCLAKAGEYKGIALSMILSQLTMVMEFLAECYLKLQKYDKALATLVKLLRVNPYKAKALKQLIEIVQQGEKPEVIAGFLGKLYDFNKEKDVILVLTVVENVGNIQLFDCICEASDPLITMKYKNR